MRHLTTLETQARLYLVAILQKLDRLILLGLVIVLINCDRKLDFLDHDDFLGLPCCTFALVFFVQKLTVILDLADRRHGIGRNLHQIEGPLAGNPQGLKWGHHAELRAGFVDHANFAGTDTIIGTDERFLRAFVVERWNRLPPWPVLGQR